MQNFIDTHSHLYDEAFAGEEDAAVKRAVSAGISKMISADISSATREAMFTLADRHPGTVFPTLGLHPTETDASYGTELEAIEDIISRKKRKIWAIGEVGLDFYWSREFEKEQKEAFRKQLEYARRLDLPVIIHSREATEAIFDILDECHGKELRGVFHAFSGSIETYRRIEKYGGWYVGIGGVLTFKKASIAETVKSIPLDHIILETDCPYLTPAPHRGQRNESAYIPFIAGKLALQKGVDIAEVAETTTKNAKQLFRI
ncbi:MAG: TatD family hydrolase [Candidatus Cryptobacteroides sp.]